MNQTVVCVHCGTMVTLETPDPLGSRLLSHLTSLHREFALGELVRWADLFEHYRVVPRRYPPIPRVVHS